jgi:hypothetical protein
MIYGEAEKGMNTKNHCGGEHTTCFVMSAPQHLSTLECTSPQYTFTSKSFYKIVTIMLPLNGHSVIFPNMPQESYLIKLWQ